MLAGSVNPDKQWIQGHAIRKTDADPITLADELPCLFTAGATTRAGSS